MTAKKRTIHTPDRPLGDKRFEMTCSDAGHNSQAFEVERNGADCRTIDALRLSVVAVSLLALLSTTGCVPLAGWSAAGYTVDESRGSRGSAVAGHCFRLRYDAEIRSCRVHIEVRNGDAVDVTGTIHVLTPGATPPSHANLLPKGSRIVVVKVLGWHNVETSSYTPYVRIDNAMIDAGELFEYSGGHVTYTGRLVEPCD